MFSSEFQYRKSILHKYFINSSKWKINNDSGLYQYYKNPKRCLKELRFMVDIVFQNDYEILETKEIMNINNELVGYSIIGAVDVVGDFNGIYQGEGRCTEYLEIALCTNGFWFNQSTILDNLLKD